MAESEPQVFTLDNPLSDSTSATLIDFKLSAAFDNDSDRPVINVSGVATDDLAGVESVYLRLNRPGVGISISGWLRGSPHKICSSRGILP